jgi:hypothetical protein
MIIYKYNIPIQDEFTIEIPNRSRFLCVQTQNNLPVMWFQCQPTEILLPHKFYIAVTGHETSKDGYGYLGTFQVNEFVGHLFYDLDKETEK